MLAKRAFIVIVSLGAGLALAGGVYLLCTGGRRVSSLEQQTLHRTYLRLAKERHSANQVEHFSKLWDQYLEQVRNGRLDVDEVRRLLRTTQKTVLDGKLSRKEAARVRQLMEDALGIRNEAAPGRPGRPAELTELKTAESG